MQKQSHRAILYSENSGGIFIKTPTKSHKGEKRYYAGLAENKQINGQAVQTVKASPKPVTEEQLPYFKAVCADKSLALFYG